MKFPGVLLACGALVSVMVNDAPAADEWNMSFGVEDFRWREFNNGSRLLEESGLRYALGLGLVRPPPAKRIMTASWPRS